MFDLLLSDIDNLIAYIDNCTNSQNAQAVAIIARRYERILKRVTGVELTKGLSSVEEIEELVSPHLVYPAYVSELEALKNRITIYSKNSNKVDIGFSFEKIRKIIIGEIEKAKLLIWVNVAWFSDKSIYDSLIRAKNRGLNVQVIMIDDRSKGNSLNSNNSLEIKYAPEYKVGETNLHNKFCIFDLETVIEGSYNWTYQAGINYESIFVVQNREIAKSFALQFVEIKRSLS